MKRIIEFVMAVVCSVFLFGFGCEAIPDGDDVERLRERVAGLPQGVMHELRIFAANRVAYGWLLGRGEDEKVGFVRCQDESTYDFTVKEMKFCLNQYQSKTYIECLRMMDAIIEYDLKVAEDCYGHEVEAHFDPDKLPDEFKVERVTVDSVVQALLGPPPPIEIQMLLIGAGGFTGPGGVLCPQGVDWACADDPLDGDQSPTTSAASGGGDR